MPVPCPPVEPLSPPRLVSGLAGLLVAMLLAGCAAMPEAIGQLPWRDQQGDRGAGVRARDWAACSQAVESRRSGMAECMARKGWRVDADRG